MDLPDSYLKKHSEKLVSVWVLHKKLTYRNNNRLFENIDFCIHACRHNNSYISIATYSDCVLLTTPQLVGLALFTVVFERTAFLLASKANSMTPIPNRRTAIEESTVAKVNVLIFDSILSSIEMIVYDDTYMQSHSMIIATLVVYAYIVIIPVLSKYTASLQSLVMFPHTTL